MKEPPALRGKARFRFSATTDRASSRCKPVLCSCLVRLSFPSMVAQLDAAPFDAPLAGIAAPFFHNVTIGPSPSTRLNGISRAKRRPAGLCWPRLLHMREITSIWHLHWGGKFW